MRKLVLVTILLLAVAVPVFPADIIVDDGVPIKPSPPIETDSFRGYDQSDWWNHFGFYERDTRKFALAYWWLHHTFVWGN
jgi:hypothetical protein